MPTCDPKSSRSIERAADVARAAESAQSGVHFFVLRALKLQDPSEHSSPAIADARQGFGSSSNASEGNNLSQTLVG